MDARKIEMDVQDGDPWEARFSQSERIISTMQDCPSTSGDRYHR